MTRKRRKPDTTAEIGLGDLTPEIQEQFRRMLASPEHQANLQRQAEWDAARRKQLEAEYQTHLRRERLRDAEEEQGLAEAERRIFGNTDRKPTGRPVEITWQMVRDKRALLRSQGEKGTQQQVADRLGCTIETREAPRSGEWRLVASLSFRPTFRTLC